MSFDPGLADCDVATLPIDRVIDPLDIGPDTHAPDRIARYRDQMAAGERFPPIAVVRLCGRYLVADGHKRLAAYRSLGPADILVQVWPLQRWVRDQWQQAVANARKNRTIIVTSVRDPRSASRLLLTTVLHWKRVVTSLALWAARLKRP
jgi:hypothetical protein